MASMSSIHLLDSFRPFFRIFTIYNAENFQIANRRKKFFKITEAILSALVPWLTIVFVFAYCRGKEFHLNVIAQPFSVMLGIVQALLIYVALAMHNRLISETIESLRTIIEQREFSITFHSNFCVILSFHSLFPLKNNLQDARNRRPLWSIICKSRELTRWSRWYWPKVQFYLHRSLLHVQRCFRFFMRSFNIHRRICGFYHLDIGNRSTIKRTHPYLLDIFIHITQIKYIKIGLNTFQEPFPHRVWSLQCGLLRRLVASIRLVLFVLHDCSSHGSHIHWTVLVYKSDDHWPQRCNGRGWRWSKDEPIRWSSKWAPHYQYGTISHRNFKVGYMSAW